MSPRAASLPLMLLPPVFSLLLLLLLSLLRGRYFLLPLPVVVSDTRCWCAAAVLRCCCLGPPIFRYSSHWNHPSYSTRFSDISSSFRQTPDCSDILTFWSPLHENLRVH